MILTWLKPALLSFFLLLALLVGVIPGVGGVTAGFMSYKIAKGFTNKPEEFGKGSEEGVVASESSNSALGGGR